MTLKVYNTKTREKEEFQPINDKKVGMYVCGPTVYDDCHVGHARSYVAFDVIRRYLEFKGYQVTYVQNFTDIDDKIINRSAEMGIEPKELAKRNIKEYFNDMDQLNIMQADSYPKASEYISEIQEVVEGLISKGHAYRVGADVYFSVETAKDIFGQLRHQSLDDMLDGARIQVNDKKRNPKDFALWKAAKPGEIFWDSPWGKGRPGWHIECSTMAAKLLGETIDIHGGGMDLIFPHHESEILQSECYTDKTFVKYWLHNGFLQINKEKMSKSVGNFFTVKEILQRFDPMVLRFFLLHTHYRSPIDFSEEALDESEKSLDRLTSFRKRVIRYLDAAEPAVKGDSIFLLELEEKTSNAFVAAMDDDFNTRKAIAAIFTMVNVGNKLLDEMTEPYPREGLNVILERFDSLSQDILGLDLEMSDSNLSMDTLTPELVELLIRVRKMARKDKNWKIADLIRDELKEIGISIEDSGDETTWNFE